MPYRITDGFPEDLQKAERDLIEKRRALVGRVPAAPKPGEAAEPEPGYWGLALSGGGIRSATFCLGVLQSLARAKVLPNFDYLSTVSGGGFIGGYLGAAIHRNGIDATQEELADDCSRTIRWFRENGRYLAPNGMVDLWSAAATMLRNLLSLHVVVGSTLLAIMLAIQGIRGLMVSYGTGSFYDWIEPQADGSLFLVSPLLPLALLPLVAWFLPAAWAYWLTQRRGSWLPPYLGAFATLIGAVVICFLPLPQNDVTPIHLMAIRGAGAIAFGALIFWALAAYMVQQSDDAPSPPGIRRASLSMIGIGLLAVAGGIVWLMMERFQPIVGPILGLFALAGIAAGSMLAKAFEAEALREHRRQLRAWLSRALTSSLLVIVGFLIVGVGDSLAQSLYQYRIGRGFGAYGSLLASIFIGITAALPWIQKATGFLGLKLKTSVGVIAALAAVLLGGLYMVGLSVVAYWIRLGGEPIGAAGDLFWLTVWLIGLVVTVLLVGRLFGFVNTSSLQDFYAARLTRAYVGASNPDRVGGPAPAAPQAGPPAGPAAPPVAPATSSSGTPVTEALPTDDVLLPHYAPHLRGGPLHLINVTLNETVSGKSQIEQQDRRGLPLAVGPAGLSLGIHHHAVWRKPLGSASGETPNPAPAGVDERTQVVCAGPLAAAGDTTSGQTYQVWPQSRDKKASPIAPESLSLGYLMGISGAAFSTGLGARTSMANSVLAGLFNVRLGYWWDSGVGPGERDAEVRLTFPQMVGRAVARVLPVQMALLDEFLGRFHGPARRRWYLSDGGHYENTACYELLRRRLPVMVVCDCGADPGYGFGDIGALLRLARTDFGAEIHFFDDAERNQVLEEVRKQVGILTELEPSEVWHTDCKVGSSHIAIARVTYKDSKQQSVLIVLKPSLSKTLPMELLEYHLRQRSFPQQPTTDQFFDEAQWESYRLLGAEIGAAAARLLTKESLARLATI